MHISDEAKRATQKELDSAARLSERKCILCGQPTTGSTGAAGLKWPFICQPCKDDEDRALSTTLKQQAAIMTAIMEGKPKLCPSHQPTS